MKIADIIYMRRKELHMTLEQVGNIVGVSKNTVRRWEIGGIANMRRDRIAKLAEALQIDALDLIGEDGSADLDNAYIRIWAQPLVNAYQEAPDYIQKAICEMLSIDYLTIPKILAERED